MAKQISKPDKPTSAPKLVGVFVRPREQHWAELLKSVDSADEALAEGQFAPTKVALPKSRMMPVYETHTGERVTLEPTPDGYLIKPFLGGSLLEISTTGGVGGGFLPSGNAPPLPMAGAMSAAAWANGYMSRVPEHTDLAQLQSKWGEQSRLCAEAVANRTSPDEDEWGQKYFSTIQEALSQRDGLYQSPGTASKGPQYYSNTQEWKQDEYHASLFAQYGQAAIEDRKNTAAARTSAPEGLFVHAARSRMLALAAAAQKNGPGLPLMFYQLLEPEVSARTGQALQAHLAEQAKAPKGEGQPVDKLRATLDFLKKINEAGGGALLAGMLQNGLLGKGEKGSDLDKLRGDFVKSLAQMGINQGLEKIMGKQAAGLLAGTGITGMFANAAKDLLTTGTTDLAAGAQNLLDNLPNNLVDMGLDSLLGKVDDKSSAAKQLLAKYKDQIKSLLKKLLSPGGLDDLQKQWDAIWKSMPSKATVPLGLADPMGGADMVYVNGMPATRIGDICKWTTPPDAGPFFQGNPTIRINGMFPSGAIHAAKGALGTIGTPLNLSPNVLMGEATISLKIKVKTESPKAAASSPTGTSGAAGDKASAKSQEKKPGSSSGNSTAKPQDLRDQNQAPTPNYEKPQLSDEQKKEFQGLANREAELDESIRQQYGRADRGEVSTEEAMAAAEKLRSEMAQIQSQMDKIRSGGNPGDFDSDGYLALPPQLPAKPEQPAAIPYGPGNPDWERETANDRVDPVFTDGDIIREAVFYPIKPAKWIWKGVKFVVKQVVKRIQKHQDKDNHD